MGALNPETPAPRLQVWHWLVMGLTLLGLAWVFWSIGEKRVAGFTHDDGVYLITAKALTMGKGPTLLHVVTQPFEIKYPYLYSLLLMPVWWLNPEFPANIPWFTLVSLSCSTLGLGLCWLYLWRLRELPFWISGVVTILTAANFYFAYFASAIMAEGAYLLFSFLALFVAELWLAQEKPLSVRQLIGLCILSALVFHTRQIGLTLTAAIFTVMLVQRQFRTAVIYLAATMGLTFIPWGFWCWLNTPQVITPLNYPLVTAYSSYSHEWLNNINQMSYWKRFIGTAAGVIDRILEAMFTFIYNFFKVVSGFWPTLDQNRLIVQIYLLVRWGGCYLLLWYFLMLMIRTVNIWRQNHQIKISVGTAYLLYYLALVILWGYEDQVARFLVAVVPLLWAVFLKPLVLKRRWYPALVLILVIALIPTYKTLWSIGYVRERDWVDMEGRETLWPDYEAAFEYVRDYLPSDAILATSNDALFYLYTNRKTFYANQSVLHKERPDTPLMHALEEIYASMKHYRVTYLIVEPDLKSRFFIGPENPITAYPIKRYPDRFRLLYVTPHQFLKIYRVLPGQP